MQQFNNFHEIRSAFLKTKITFSSTERNNFYCIFSRSQYTDVISIGAKKTREQQGVVRSQTVIYYRSTNQSLMIHRQANRDQSVPACFIFACLIVVNKAKFAVQYPRGYTLFR